MSTRRGGGMTLLEVLLAVFVVTIPIFAILSVLIAVSGGIRKSQGEIQAVNVARMQMDAKIAEGRINFDGVVSGPVTPAPVDPVNFPGLSHTFLVAGTYLGNPEVKKLDVTVYWQDGRGGRLIDRRYVIATLLAK